MKSFPANPLASALLAGALSLTVPSLLAVQEPTQSPQDQGQSQQRDNGQATENSFAGRITKGNSGKFMLEDASKSTSFALDNQKLAKKFEGKNVVVTGTLDQANNILHVKKIELAA
ncbi:MAG TPA: DUF5818 domain-containing protein [Candidatus Eisenbacteria bacterium]|jgi:cytochrome c-type biogenesis protein CcmE|nr:DUF5818 domain-containing protein [Candidatus Eisenbacteria bacterium]